MSSLSLANLKLDPSKQWVSKVESDNNYLKKTYGGEIKHTPTKY
jgi:hypothetical protein